MEGVGALPSSAAYTSFDLTLLLHLLSSCSSASPKLLSFVACLLLLLAMWVLVGLISWAHPGGPAWGLKSLLSKPTKHSPIPGPRGLPLFGSLLAFAGAHSSTAHRRLAALASLHNAHSLMALTFGSTRIVVSSEPSVAKEILCNSAFAERPLTQSARQLLFARAIGFSPRGNHWRNLRHLSAAHLFSPRRIAAQEHVRQLDASVMLDTIAEKVALSSVLMVRPHLQHAALNSIMATVFGRRYAFSENAVSGEAYEVQRMVQEGFELLGTFNMADHLPPAFESIDPMHIRQRCNALVPRVFSFVQAIIDEHRNHNNAAALLSAGTRDNSDFVDTLLALQGEEKLSDSDMVSILWEMIFRGTDTMAILTEWILAELVLNPRVQAKLQAEVDMVAKRKEGCALRDADIARMPYLQAVVKEGLRMHPPGPLLSWARLAVHDVEVGGHFVPAGTTAMVNMWAITHDPTVWADPEKFRPERFVVSEGGENVDVRGSDMRLAPFGAGARACPGKALALSTVNMWVAAMVQRFSVEEDPRNPVDLSEVLKLSCEMAVPLTARFVERSIPLP